MPGPNCERVQTPNHRTYIDDTSSAIQEDSTAAAVKGFDVDRWARLIADGQATFPRQLTPSTRAALVRRVAQIRRSRLLNFIARAIAHDIHSSCDSKGE
jgi:hypothetical protein